MIDLDLVNKMKIPLQKIKVCRMNYLGEDVRSVGYIDQTISCVHNGVVQGTVHLSAKVVRNLFENFKVDCVASYKTYERLNSNRTKWRKKKIWNPTADLVPTAAPMAGMNPSARSGSSKLH